MISMPQGGIIPGQGSLVGLDGWTVEEMNIDAGAAMAIDFPRLGGGGRGFFRFGPPRPFSEMEKRYTEQVAQLDDWMDAGRHYARAVAAGAATRDLSLEAMARLVNREIPAVIQANGERHIRDAVEWAERQNIRFVIAGAEEGWELANLIVTAGDPLEIQTRILDVFILGDRVSTDNKHKSLHEEYRSRPRERVIR
ncbi:MAG: hypothetical protein OEZ65_10030 [Gemmatimonadota bacterium]|nr:hypothetical protein [Gemmatimonadota bacterium]